jgi:transcriptional regulator with XRE-family HTH domain
MQTPIAANLARNIRQLRELRRLTQGQLARSAGIPRPTLTHLESGDSNPTIQVLSRLANSLQISVEELISPPRAECQLYRAEELRQKRRGEVVIRRLLPDTIRNLELDRMELAPGARMGGVPHREGTREYLACESGTIQVSVAGQDFDVGPGDVLVFRGDQKHSYANRGGKTAVGYSVVMVSLEG